LLHFQQLSFSFDAPAVSGQAAIGSDDAVAGDDYGGGIGSAGSGYGSGCGRLSDFFGELRVGPGFSARNGAEGLPDAHLKGGCAEIEGQVERGGMFRELRENLIEHGREFGIGLEIGGGELLAELGGGFSVSGCGNDRAQALFGCGDEDVAEG
jgi:hypothetical protein